MTKFPIHVASYKTYYRSPTRGFFLVLAQLRYWQHQLQRGLVFPLQAISHAEWGGVYG